MIYITPISVVRTKTNIILPLFTDYHVADYYTKMPEANICLKIHRVLPKLSCVRGGIVIFFDSEMQNVFKRHIHF